MSPRKKDRLHPAWALIPGAGKLIELVRSPYSGFMVGAGMVMVFLGAWAWVWGEVRTRALASEEYWLGLSNVEITPLPPWIHHDVRGEVFRDASLDRPLSILDDDLTDRLAAAFRLHPWVAEVRRVRKYCPARATVDLVFRRPVCMVQVPGGLLPVDITGVLLPSGDFSPLEAGGYPRLVGVETLPVGPPGERWGDIRVAGAAEIAAAFGPVWDKLNLQRIVPVSTATASSNREDTYTIYTKGGTRILWGRAPSTALAGEVAAEEKVARLEKYAAENGSLDCPNSQPEIDVRGLKAAGGRRSPNSRYHVFR
jgi:hypothetical protein